MSGTVWAIRGLPLPAALVALLRDGRWVHPGRQALHDVMPWFEDPLMFPADLRDLQLHNRSLDLVADDRSIRDLFRTTRGSRADRPDDLPWLDVDRAVLIAVNEYAGDDVCVALDYRTDPADPRVVASDVWTDPPHMAWRVVSPTFTEFVAALRLA